LAWAPDIPLEYVEVGGNKLRFIRSGAGPKVVPELSKHFTIYALDYPGHGYSDIPKARYNMTPLSSLTRSKASSKSSTFAMSLSLGFLLAGRSHSSSPPGTIRVLRVWSP
jgi:pimeloyl-ACP methyl ester carboxylesterase